MSINYIKKKKSIIPLFCLLHFSENKNSRTLSFVNQPFVMSLCRKLVCLLS